MITDLRISSISETNVSLVWVPVSCFSRNNVKLTVRITVMLLPSNQTLSNVSVADSGNYTVSGLMPGTMYSFEVTVVDVEIPAERGVSVTGMTPFCKRFTHPISVH